MSFVSQKAITGMIISNLKASAQKQQVPLSQVEIDFHLTSPSTYQAKVQTTVVDVSAVAPVLFRSAVNKFIVDALKKTAKKHEVPEQRITIGMRGEEIGPQQKLHLRIKLPNGETFKHIALEDLLN